jgi:hypothetical protein
MGYKNDAQRKAVHASRAENKSAATKKDFPEIKEKNEGKFTSWAKKNEFRDACSAATSVLNNKDSKGKKKNYGASVKKMARYANNFGCKRK